MNVNVEALTLPYDFGRRYKNHGAQLHRWSTENRRGLKWKAMNMTEEHENESFKSVFQMDKNLSEKLWLCLKNVESLTEQYQW